MSSIIDGALSEPNTGALGTEALTKPPPPLRPLACDAGGRRDAIGMGADTPLERGGRPAIAAIQVAKQRGAQDAGWPTLVRSFAGARLRRTRVTPVPLCRRCLGVARMAASRERTPPPRAGPGNTCTPRRWHSSVSSTWRHCSETGGTRRGFSHHQPAPDLRSPARIANVGCAQICYRFRARGVRAERAPAPNPRLGARVPHAR
jgi:hypothetical protein